MPDRRHPEVDVEQFIHTVSQGENIAPRQDFGKILVGVILCLVSLLVLHLGYPYRLVDAIPGEELLERRYIQVLAVADGMHIGNVKVVGPTQVKDTLPEIGAYLHHPGHTPLHHHGFGVGLFNGLAGNLQYLKIVG